MNVKSPLSFPSLAFATSLTSVCLTLSPLATQISQTPPRKSFSHTNFQKTGEGVGLSTMPFPSPSRLLSFALRIFCHLTPPPTSFLSSAWGHHRVGVSRYPQLGRFLSPLGHPPARAAPSRIFAGHGSHGFSRCADVCDFETIQGLGVGASAPAKARPEKGASAPKELVSCPWGIYETGSTHYSRFTRFPEHESQAVHGQEPRNTGSAFSPALFPVHNSLFTPFFLIYNQLP